MGSDAQSRRDKRMSGTVALILHEGASRFVSTN
jgi:hypothetical protein